VHVIFVEPRFPANQQRFVRGLRAAGARVTGIGESSVHSLGGELQGLLHAYEQVPSVCHEPSMLDAVRRIQARGPVHALEATVEAHIMPVARVREEVGIPGTSVRTAWLCRDKPAMKEALREAGVPTAASTGADSAEEVRDFVRRVGFPVILKPRSAAGAAGTFRAGDAAELERVIAETQVDRGSPVAVEEYIEGHEGFYDTLSVNGRVVLDFASHYYPNVLEAMRTRWISPQILTTNRIGEPGYDEVKAMGARVIEVLGIGTSATHMEWFYGPKGLKFSEIGCRPPGVGVWDLYSAANDIDLYEQWGHAIANGRVPGRASRRFSTGMIALRPDRDGRVVRYDGLDELQARFGDRVIDMHIPPVGSPTAPVEGGYMANAWIRLRHPDYDELRRTMDWVGENVRVRAG
jgi:hypothetical protein